LQISGEDGSWIGDEGDQEKQAAVAEVEARIGAMDIAEDGVVMHPHDEDGEEAGDESEITGPELQEGFAQGGGGCAGRRDGGDFEFEDEEGDGDGEDAVAEGFEAAGLFFALGVGLWLHGEQVRKLGNRLSVMGRKSKGWAKGGRVVRSDRPKGRPLQGWWMWRARYTKPPNYHGELVWVMKSLAGRSRIVSWE
jgi:hypothetical protein